MAVSTAWHPMPLSHGLFACVLAPLQLTYRESCVHRYRQRKQLAQLLDACTCGDVARVQELLAARGTYAANDAVDEHQNTLLHRAARAGHEAVCAHLLAAGADVHRRNQSLATPLLCTQSAACAALLLEAGADVDARNWALRTPLHQASRADLVRVLLTAGADVEPRDKDGRRPLHHHNSSRVVRLLVAAGADVEARDDEGRCVLAQAHDAGIIAHLLRLSADGRASDRAGCTPLHALVRSVPFATRLLLQYGADVDARTCHQRLTPLHALLPVLDRHCPHEVRYGCTFAVLRRRRSASLSSCFRRPSAADVLPQQPHPQQQPQCPQHHPHHHLLYPQYHPLCSQNHLQHHPQQHPQHLPQHHPLYPQYLPHHHHHPQQARRISPPHLHNEEPQLARRRSSCAIATALDALLEYGADVNACDAAGQSPLYRFVYGAFDAQCEGLMLALRKLVAAGARVPPLLPPPLAYLARGGVAVDRLIACNEFKRHFFLAFNVENERQLLEKARFERWHELLTRSTQRRLRLVECTLQRRCLDLIDRMLTQEAIAAPHHVPLVTPCVEIS